MKTIAQQLGITDFPFIIKDKNGEQLYSENPNGDWEKWEYDSNGKQIYYETSNGFWIKTEYDSEGECIYHEDSDGYWRKLEYNSDGHLIYFEDSTGVIEDKRSKDEIIIDGIKYKRIDQ